MKTIAATRSALAPSLTDEQSAGARFFRSGLSARQSSSSLPSWSAAPDSADPVMRLTDRATASSVSSPRPPAARFVEPIVSPLYLHRRPSSFFMLACAAAVQSARVRSAAAADRIQLDVDRRHRILAFAGSSVKPGARLRF
jgi:hypothetical protein